MAALGTRSIADSAIKLDAYAVLANGDPSQLDSSSKRLLVNRLTAIESQDPEFPEGETSGAGLVLLAFSPQTLWK